MGGLVSVIIKSPNKDIHKTVCHTSNITPLTTNIGYIQNNLMFLLDYLDTCKDDTLCQQYTKSISPVDYGIIVIDTVKKRILSMQEHTNICRVTSSDLLLDYSAYKNLLEFAQNNKINKILSIHGKEEMAKQIINNQQLFYNSLEFFYDMNPYNIVTFPTTGKGIFNIFKEILKLGFEISKREKVDWFNYIYFKGCPKGAMPILPYFK